MAWLPQPCVAGRYCIVLHCIALHCIDGMASAGVASARGHHMQGTEHDIAFFLALGFAADVLNQNIVRNITACAKGLQRSMKTVVFMLCVTVAIWQSLKPFCSSLYLYYFFVGFSLLGVLFLRLCIGKIM
mgnify:CR=1 FL=1